MGRRRRWIVLASALIVLALPIGVWVVLVERPIADDEELAAAGAYAGRALEDVSTQRCDREPLDPSAIDGDGTAELAALLDGSGRFASCYAFLRANEDEVREVLVAQAAPAGAHDLPDSPLAAAAVEPDEPPVAEPWTSFMVGRVVHASRLPIEERTLSECADLAAASQRAVAHRSVCAPWGLAFPGDVAVIPLARAISIEARDRLREGRPRAALELVLDLMLGFTDLARGRTSIVSAVIGAVGIGFLAGQLEMLLAIDAGWSDEDLRELERRVTLLAHQTPLPDGFVRDDPVVMLIEALQQSGWSSPLPLPPPGPPDPTAPLQGDARAGVLASVLVWQRQAIEREALRCEGTLEQCVATIDACVAAARSVPLEPRAPWRSWAFGLRSTREPILARAEAESMQSVEEHLAQYALSAVAIRALWLVIEHRRLSLSGVCPTVDQMYAATRAAPTEVGLGGSFAIFPSGLPYRPIEIGAPMWMAPRDDTRPLLRLPVAHAYCPPFPLAP